MFHALSQAAAEAQKFVKRQLVQVPAPEILFLLDLRLPLQPLASFSFFSASSRPRLMYHPANFF